ncbi:hypothetical protein JL721_9926 [Aureococcus anophagefferens]|nr:hypothetical protein JL721_9926 [Aureococcus anophagefferens]
MAAIATLPRALARRHARTLSLKDTSRFAPDNDGQYWPKTNSPEWLALQKRPSSGGPIGPRAPHDGGPIGPRAPRDGGPIGPRAPRDGGNRSFFGIPADDAPPVRSPVEEGWLEQRRKARIEERAREQAAEARFDKIQATNGAKPSGSPSALARPHRREAAARALDLEVVGQHAAKRAIAVAVAEHYGHARRCLEDPTRRDATWHKKNLLLLGPSGCGKTQLCRALAKVVDAAYVKADATKFSATGYVGRDVDDVVAQLVDAAGDDREAAEFGVVHVDEIDKVCERPGGLLGGGASVNTRDVQTSLLKLMEDAELAVGNKGPPVSVRAGAKPASATFSTKFVLWIFSGAFLPLLDRLAREGAAGPSARDLVESGLIHEFVGRVPVRCALDPLSADDLVSILAADGAMSPLHQQKAYFETYDIELTVGDDALEAIAERALAHGLGARCLRARRVLRGFAFHLPSADAHRLHLDAALVADPAAALDRALRDAGAPPAL